MTPNSIHRVRQFAGTKSQVLRKVQGTSSNRRLQRYICHAVVTFPLERNGYPIFEEQAAMALNIVQCESGACAKYEQPAGPPGMAVLAEVGQSGCPQSCLTRKTHLRH